MGGDRPVNHQRAFYVGVLDRARGVMVYYELNSKGSLVKENNYPKINCEIPLTPSAPLPETNYQYQPTQLPEETFFRHETSNYDIPVAQTPPPDVPVVPVPEERTQDSIFDFEKLTSFISFNSEDDYPDTNCWEDLF